MIVSQPLFFSGYEIAPCFFYGFICFFFLGGWKFETQKNRPMSHLKTTSGLRLRGVKTHSEAEVTTGGPSRALFIWWVMVTRNAKVSNISQRFLGILGESVGNYYGSLRMVSDSSLWICFCWCFFLRIRSHGIHHLKPPIFWNRFLGQFFHEFETRLSSEIFMRFITSLCGIEWVYGWERYFVSSKMLFFLMQCKHCINTLTLPLFLSNLGFCIGVVVDFLVEIRLDVFLLFKPFLLWRIYSERILLAILPRMREFNDFSWNMATGETARAPNASLLNHDYGKDRGFRGLVLVMWLYLL